MSRIQKTFADLDRPALVTFITAGDPDHDTSLSIMKSLPASGADIIELGMPFTDPMADGPVIQLGNQRALSCGANMKKTLQMVRAFRKDDENTPIVLMGYANPVFQFGLKEFARDASAAGIDGVIIVDLPPEESDPLQEAFKGHDLDIIRLVTPTTDSERLHAVLEGASGFIYYVSITGITGAASANTENVSAHIKDIQSQTELPVVVGFGIKTPDDAKTMGQIADGIVVGSSIVQNIAQNTQNNSVAQIISEQVKALSAALR